MEKLFYEGSARYSAADYTGAIESFTAALEIVTHAGADPSVRGALLLNLGKAHVKAHELDGEIRHLKTAREIYRRYVNESDEAGYPEADVADARSQIEALDAQISEIEATATTATTTPPTGDDPAPDASDSGDAKKKRAAGIGLVAGGGLFLAGGVGALIFGTTFRPDAEIQIEDMMIEGTPEAQSYLDQEVLKGQVWMGVGASVAVIGAAAVAAGAVLLVRAKKSSSDSASLWVAPGLGRGSAGLTLGGRF